MRDNLVLLHANKKSADQPAHPHSLIEALVIHYLTSIEIKLAPWKISLFKLFSVA